VYEASYTLALTWQIVEPAVFATDEKDQTKDEDLLSLKLSDTRVYEP